MYETFFQHCSDLNLYSVLDTSEKVGLTYTDKSLYKSHSNYKKFRRIDSLKMRMREAR